MTYADFDYLAPANISILVWHCSPPKMSALKISEMEYFPLLTNIQ